MLSGTLAKTQHQRGLGAPFRRTGSAVPPCVFSGLLLCFRAFLHGPHGLLVRSFLLKSHSAVDSAAPLPSPFLVLAFAMALARTIPGRSVASCCVRRVLVSSVFVGQVFVIGALWLPAIGGVVLCPPSARIVSLCRPSVCDRRSLAAKCVCRPLFGWQVLYVVVLCK